MTEKQKINKLARSFGVKLNEAGIRMIKNAFHLKPIVMSRKEVRSILSDVLGINSLSLSDRKYYTINWEEWKSIIEVDWTDKIKYQVAKFDCDNFSFLFASRMAEIFGVNSAGVAFGDLHKPHTDIKIGRHAFNIILTANKEVYLYEAMNDKYIKIEKGKKPIIKSWEYNCDWAIFY